MYNKLLILYNCIPYSSIHTNTHEQNLAFGKPRYKADFANCRKLYGTKDDTTIAKQKTLAWRMKHLKGTLT